MSCVESIFVAKNYTMDWQNILMMGVALALILIWVPILLFSVRKTLRKESNNNKTTR